MTIYKEKLAPLPHFLKPMEVAEHLRISRAKMYRLMKSGTIRSVKLGGTRLIAADQYLEFVEGLIAK